MLNSGDRPDAVALSARWWEPETDYVTVRQTPTCPRPWGIEASGLLQGQVILLMAVWRIAIGRRRQGGLRPATRWSTWVGSSQRRGPAPLGLTVSPLRPARHSSSTPQREDLDLRSELPEYELYDVSDAAFQKPYCSLEGELAVTTEAARRLEVHNVTKTFGAPGTERPQPGCRRRRDHVSS